MADDDTTALDRPQLIVIDASSSNDPDDPETPDDTPDDDPDDPEPEAVPDEDDDPDAASSHLSSK